MPNDSQVSVGTNWGQIKNEEESIYRELPFYSNGTSPCRPFVGRDRD